MAAGDEVLLLYPSANRDAGVFDHPMAFDIRRSPNEHVAFGFGPHFCLGNSLARLELSIMFDRLADRLPDIHLGAGIASEGELHWRGGHVRSGHTRQPLGGVTT